MATKSNVKPTFKEGDFGEIYTQFYHKPKEAIKFLCKKKSGECSKALHRADIGDIDIIWGEVTDRVKHTGFGLAHIIDKHGKDIKALGFEVEDFIALVIMYGEVKKEVTRDKIICKGHSFKFIVKTKWNGRKKIFLLTAFNLTKKPPIKSGKVRK